MTWYYMKRGNVRVRNILSESQLSMMVRAGDIDKDDLLWSEQTQNKWVRASSVPDLFPANEPAAESTPEQHKAPAAEQQPEPPEQTPAPEKGHHHKSAIVAVIIAVIAIAGVLAANKLKSAFEEPEPAPAPPPQPEQTNAWKTVEADLAALLKGGMVDEANDLISAYTDDMGEDAVSARLRNAVRTHVQAGQLQKMYEDFIRGTLDAKGKKEFLSTAEELGEMDKLKKSLHLVLSAKKPPSEALCQSILALSRELSDESLSAASLNTLASVLGAAESEEGCLKMVKVYSGEGMGDEALALLQQFVEANPEAANAWYELTAHLAQADRKDEALEALKTAMKLGGKDARIDARRDERFDPIKDTMTFKWNTR